MKNQFIYFIKDKIPLYYSRMMDVIDLLFIYQLLLFILSPSKIMGILLGIIFILLVLNNNIY